ncbi:hypothetical protein KHQ81_10225 [Mycoplasmatota bacterium]|nr:hypothetical protein KHQ81_10225 [Mycoplasmatota bacterium]
MAIWQYVFYIIPKDKFDKYDNLNITNIIDNITWEGYEINENSIKTLSNILKPSKSWSEDIKQLGEIDKTCIEFIYENDVLENIEFRLDLRDITKDIINLILEFIRDNNALIVCDNKIINPEYKDITENIRLSKTFSFIKNPLHYLKMIK